MKHGLAMTQATEIAMYLVWLARQEPDEPDYLTPMRLQKLLYYVQGWSLGINRTALFQEPIEAWKHGPVVRSVYARFAQYKNRPIDEEIEAEPIDSDERTREFITHIWDTYKQYSASKLREMTHREPPWLIARGDCGPDDVSDHEISHHSLLEYFEEQYRDQKPRWLDTDALADADRQFKAGRGIPLEQVVKGLDNI